MNTEAKLPGPHRSVARVTIQLETPLTIGTGLPGDFEDERFVVDANGLPALPGTSIAGVLRSAWETHESESVDEVFGYVGKVWDDREKESKGVGARSAVTVSWGSIHDTSDRPVPSLADPKVVAEDWVLAFARSGLQRDHVGLDAFGVVEGRKKFDRTSVCAGHRFTFEIECQGQTSQADRLRKIVEVLKKPSVRFGGHSCAGLGAFSLVRAAVGDFDLSRPEDFSVYAGLPAELSEAADGLANWPDATKEPTSGQGFATYSIKLTPLEPWVVGGPAESWQEGPTNKDSKDGARVPDLVPYRESRLAWDPENKPSLQEGWFVVPATAFKGAIRHRVAYHLRAGERQETEVGKEVRGRAEDLAWSVKEFGQLQEPDGLYALFGRAHEAQGGAGGRKDSTAEGQRGRFYPTDAWVDPAKVGRRVAHHVSLDRFTGAPMAGLLFSDEALEGGKLEFELVVKEEPRGPALDRALEALEEVFKDIRNGMFQLGAGYGRGYGWFEGEVKKKEASDA